MTGSPAPQLLQELRQLIARVISEAKAYEVPGLCTRLGLEGGTEEEAFRSKHRYAQKRLSNVSNPDLIRMGEILLTTAPNYELAEVIHKIGESGSASISELTRRRIVAVLDGEPLCTQVQESEFLRRVWPLEQMGNLEAEIFRHFIWNSDWSNRELLEHLGVLTCSLSQFFRFLEGLVDPVVRTDVEQLVLVEQLNNILKNDGYALKSARQISGSPFFSVVRLAVGAPSDASISATLRAFDVESVHQRWSNALERRESDAAGAITLARTLLEDVCKWLLDQEGVPFADNDDLPQLYRKVAKRLSLAPDDYTEQVFKQILGSCQSVVESLGALRNKLSDAHSPGPKRAKPAARHAELAVNLAGAMATFLVATWQARKSGGGEA